MLTNNEWEFINSSSNPSDRFIALWTQKETIIKASGYGFSLHLDSFEISNEHKTEIKNQIYSVKEIFTDATHKCHLAIKKGDFPQVTEAALFLSR